MASTQSAPKVMMPKAMTQQLLKAKFVELKENRQVSSMIDIIEDLIKATSNYFGVTIIAAQKRIAEFGVEEARGAFNYIDGPMYQLIHGSRGSLALTKHFQ